MLLKLVDGGIENIRTDEDSISGCETCDYGSEYINYIDIEMTKYSIHAEINQMYDYAISIKDALDLFLPNIEEILRMTEEEFIQWFKEWLYDKAGIKLGEPVDEDGYGVTFVVKEYI